MIRLTLMRQWRRADKPRMAPNFENPIATLRPSLVPTCRLAAWLFAGITLLAVVMSLQRGDSATQLARLILLEAAVFVGLALLVGALVWPRGVTVYLEGIRGRSYWGRRVFIPWDAVSELSFDDSSGVVFVVVRSGEDGPAIWTVPDVVERAEFQALAARLVSGPCPLKLDQSAA